MSETVKYLENQYHEGELVLLGQCIYELKRDSLNDRYFVVNQNNKLIYLDQIESVPVVKFSSNKISTTLF